MVLDAGATATAKFAVAAVWTMICAVAVFVIPPPVPVMVSIYVPGVMSRPLAERIVPFRPPVVGRIAVVATVRVLAVPCEVGVTDVGLNVAVAPVGTPETDRLTLL